MTAAASGSGGTTVVIGAGVSGLGFANGWRERHPEAAVVVLEAEHEPGGYCRTVVRDGFVWDYSGHFFHFKEPAIERWLRDRMPGQDVRTVIRRAVIRYAGRDIDFPFQNHIHQLPRDEFLECLVDLFEASQRPAGEPPPASFGELLVRRLGRGITEKFLRPYNEKLYATDLDRLDVSAMGRFFPHASFGEIVAGMRPRPAGGGGGPGGIGYNATFTYPAGGAVQYIHALLRDLPAGTVACGEPVTAIDLAARHVVTPRRRIAFDRVVSSAPLPALARLCGVAHDAGVFSSNQVLVYNLGFDRKGPPDVHWMYFPDPSRVFYRVGWYDNILPPRPGASAAGDRMSLYVEIGAPHGARIDVEALRGRVLADLRREAIVTDHQLIAHHHVVLDPAYVHITQASLAETARLRAALAERGVHSIGRYGGWTYCSIEDNLIEARALAAALDREPGQNR
ncbi:MAG TPA: FAD-dependent oxidoreductase [Kofleriaceae bacterium]|nr:FAD-dependent oxidoreductase [Kofleriaceae bacterium]